MSSCPLKLSRSSRAFVAAAMLAFASSAAAQTSAEIVRYDYAQVLRVQPVHAASVAGANWVPCPPSSAIPGPPGRHLSRVVGAVKGALRRPTAASYACGEPVAFDVDYVYKGMKYRSRLTDDPGTRLRLRVSVMPSPMPESDAR